MYTLVREPMMDATVCMVLMELYTRALKRDDKEDIKDIERAFIKAKKMNKKLIEYKFQLRLHDVPDEIKKELFGDVVVWEKELEKVRTHALT